MVYGIIRTIDFKHGDVITDGRFTALILLQLGVTGGGTPRLARLRWRRRRVQPLRTGTAGSAQGCAGWRARSWWVAGRQRARRWT